MGARIAKLQLDAPFGRSGKRLGARARAKLPEDRFGMEFHRVQRDVESPRDRFVGESFADRTEDLDLARREESLGLGLGGREARRLDDLVPRLFQETPPLGGGFPILGVNRYAQAPPRERLHRPERPRAPAPGP